MGLELTSAEVEVLFGLAGVHTPFDEVLMLDTPEMDASRRNACARLLSEGVITIMRGGRIQLGEEVATALATCSNPDLVLWMSGAPDVRGYAWLDRETGVVGLYNRGCDYELVYSEEWAEASSHMASRTGLSEAKAVRPFGPLRMGITGAGEYLVDLESRTRDGIIEGLTELEEVIYSTDVSAATSTALLVMATDAASASVVVARCVLSSDGICLSRRIAREGSWYAEYGRCAPHELLACLADSSAGA